MLGGVISVAQFTTGHEQTQENRVCYFHLFDVVLSSKGSNLSEFIFSTQYTRLMSFINKSTARGAIYGHLPILEKKN